MFKHRLDQSIDGKVLFHWFLLSFNGGCINAGGFLATGRFVSHVTGFATLFGVSSVNHSMESALGILSVPFFFLMGSFIAGMLIDRPIHQKRKPHFDYVMGLSALCLFVVTFGGEFAEFSFGEVVHLKQVYVLMALLCLACGLQNGAITSSSQRTVRTTHLTGLTTDLGLGLAKLLTYGKNEEAFKLERKFNWLRAGSIISFIVGSSAGAWFFMKFGYHGFGMPALIAAYSVYHGYQAD